MNPSNIMFISFLFSDFQSEFEPPTKKMRFEEKQVNPNKSDFEDTIEFCLPSGLKLTCSKTLIKKNSKVFDRMLDPIYTESSKSFSTITDVNEDAFVVMVHFMHDCEIDIDVNCATIECNTCRFQDNENISKRTIKTDWRFVMDLLACAERFYVHCLKTVCEQLLTKELSNENVGEIFLLSCWNNSEKLINDSLIYLLTKTTCPKWRTQYFAELLFSHERENFLERVENYLSGMLNKSDKK